MIDGIVLAAGQSSRAGVFKPAHEHDGQPLLVHAVDSLAPWCERVVVVAGCRHREVTAILAQRPWARLALNPAWEDGMFSSVQAGLTVVSRRLRGLFVLPVDCPFLSQSTATALIDAFWAHDARQVMVPEYQGRGGHPVLLPESLRETIARAPGTTTLRDVIHAAEPVRVAVDDPSVLLDLDTPNDLQALADPGAA